MISDSPQEELEYIQQPDMQILVQPGSLADRNDQSWQKQMTGLGLSKNWHKRSVFWPIGVRAADWQQR